MIPEPELERVVVLVAADDVERALPLVCEAMGEGCGEEPRPDGCVALTFWSPAGGHPGVASLERLMAGAGIEARVAVTPEPPGWQDAMLRFHRPMEVAGTILVRPPWEPARPGLHDVVVDPGMAFGTGHHATTRGCLEILAELPPASLADVGCGSGILAIAARRLGHDPVWALDLDPLAVAATAENARANGVGVDVALGEVGREPVPPARCVMANLMASILRTLAGALDGHPARTAVLSGLRAPETPEIVELYSRLGFRLKRRIDEDGWATLHLDR